MVKKTHAKRKRDIKTKLMAAICMLLVSSIMMVSTTYAWFTLSTAPEVTGINTAVGANGNLEMALMPKDGQVSSITSAVGDSVLATEAKNVTWGNLVDLSDSSVYGLDKINLYPAQLNVADNKLAASILKTPSYGADGRVSQLLENTMTGTLKGNSFVPGTEFGVRAVGVASGMTDRQLAYRNARSAANTAMSQAKKAASESLSNNGGTLANVAMKKQTGGDNPTFNQADIASLQAIVFDLLGYEFVAATGGNYQAVQTPVEEVQQDQSTKTVTYTSYHSVQDNSGDYNLVETGTGTLDLIESAYLKYILAYGASKAGQDGGMDDTEFAAFAGVVNGASSLSAALTELGTYGITIAEMDTKATALNNTRTAVEAAFNGLDALNAESIDWATLKTPLEKLVNIQALTLNDIPVGEVTQEVNINKLMADMTSGKGLVVTMATQGGVYADIADHCGDYDASVTIAKVSYGGLSLNNMTARMKTAGVNPAYLVLVGEAVERALAPVSEAGEGAQVMPISDFYGYIVDLAFRTNAAESKLLLQTEAVDRIYDENTADSETMGHGSTMTFTSTTTDFTAEKLASLMGAIRVVFFNPTDGTVLGNAKLNMTEGQYTVTGGNTITAKLYLYGTDGAFITEQADAQLMALNQNQATELSVLVYLDGNNIGNDDVAATAATSMTGTMNLQFASSANLVPMNYTPLMPQGNNDNQQGGGEGSGT